LADNMSDQTPSLSNLGSVDGRNLINVSGGGGGVTSINGDATPAQTLAAGTGISVVDGGGGTHTISTNAIQVITTDDVAPNFGTSVFFHALVEGAVSPAITTRQTVPDAEFAVDVRNFLSGHGGLVTDPGGAAATDYLGADNTFRPIPAGGGITSINGDATAAQTLASTGLTVTDAGGGAHTVEPIGPNGAFNVPLAPASGRGFIVLLGMGAVGLGTNGITNLFLTPAAGFTRMVIVKMILVDFSGAVVFDTNTISMGTNAGAQVDWLPVTILNGASVDSNSSICFQPDFTSTQQVTASWTPNEQVQFTVAGGGIAVNAVAQCWGYYE
jgi:hypothetical protein